MRYLTAPIILQMLTFLVVSAFVVFLFFPPHLSTAAPLDNRSVELIDNRASATTSHYFEYDIVTPGNVGSLEFEYCSNTPFPGQPCTPPTGLDVSSASLDFQSGETGFSISGADTTTNRLVLTRGVSPAAAGTVRYEFSAIDNPDTVGSHYVRIATFASTDGTGARTDDGGLAFSINDELTLSAFVPPILIFCLGETITGTDCLTATGNNVNFGELSSSQTSTGTTQMAAGTNGVGGYAISVIGNTMTSGNHVIPALSSQAGASSGNARFGLNLVNNSSPNIGSNQIGPGTGFVDNDYNDVNLFKFTSGDTVASSPISTDMNRYTSSYIVDVDPDQNPGVYTTTITYVCLATF